jgi:hypothetical protein
MACRTGTPRCTDTRYKIQEGRTHSWGKKKGRSTEIVKVLPSSSGQSAMKLKLIITLLVLARGVEGMRKEEKSDVFVCGGGALSSGAQSFEHARFNDDFCDCDDGRCAFVCVCVCVCARARVFPCTMVCPLLPQHLFRSAVMNHKRQRAPACNSIQHRPSSVKMQVFLHSTWTA